MPFDEIVYRIEDGIATITLSRPDRMNAFTPRMQAELLRAFDLVDADDDVRAVIVTGAGRAFCAGADLDAGPNPFESGAAGADVDDADDSARDGGGLLTLRIFRCLKPVIGAINGASVGIGATMTLPMDIRLASEEARFGFVFARRGIVPEAASSYFLPRIVGIGQALEWCLGGRVFAAEEALRGGLVRAVVPGGELLAAARAAALEIARHSAPVAVALTRQMLWRGLGMTDPMEAHRIDSRVILSRGRSADAAEGVAAFLAKRPAAFPDTVSSNMPDFFPWWDEQPYR